MSSFPPQIGNSSISKYVDVDGKFHPKLGLIFAFVIIFVFNRFGLLELIELKIIIINEMNNIHYTYRSSAVERDAILWRRDSAFYTVSHRHVISDVALILYE